jgi:hypothetical protein
MNNKFFELAILYRIGLEEGKTVQLELISELAHVFKDCDSIPPKSFELEFKKKYSHRLVKKTLWRIGYSCNQSPYPKVFAKLRKK